MEAQEFILIGDKEKIYPSNIITIADLVVLVDKFAITAATKIIAKASNKVFDNNLL